MQNLHKTFQKDEQDGSFKIGVKNITRCALGAGFAVAAVVGGFATGFFAILTLPVSYVFETVSQRYSVLKLQSIDSFKASIIALKTIFGHTIPSSESIKAAKKLCKNWQDILSNKFGQEVTDYLSDSRVVHALVDHLTKLECPLSINDLPDVSKLINSLNLSEEIKTTLQEHFNYLHEKKKTDLHVFWKTVAGSIEEAEPKDLEPSLSGNFLEDALTQLLKKHSGQVTTLDLTKKNLVFLPKGIGQLEHLQGLYLRSNQLQTFPLSIAKLIQLQKLSLSDNQLTQIPTEIGNLTNLQGLYLRSNQLQTFPLSIAKLIQLQKLSLSGNQLTEIPKEIGNLINLQELWLYNNQLTEIPEEIGNLTQLQELWLSNNQLQELPEGIGNLTQLQELGLNDNQLTQIPEEIGKLINLQKLWVYNNQLQELPEEIGNLTNLQEDSLGDEQLIRIFQTLKEKQNNSLWKWIVG